ncbi:MAG: hypothetical protein JOZ72_08285 [Alphaproteobacteria bacterium]|nr:hypothetical protein [Alphaproteobacteria bacterium]
MKTVFGALSAALLIAGPAGAAANVHSALGGIILGYAIDPNGTMGVLTEYVPGGGGFNTVAVETFDQTTGAIVKTVKTIEHTKNDYVVLGATGDGTALVEYEQVSDLFVDKRSYKTMIPLEKGKLNGKWTPPKMGVNDIVNGFDSPLGSSQAAIMAFRNGGDDHTYVFTTDLAANTSSPHFKIKDPLYDFNDSPVMTYDPNQNLVIVAASTGCPSCVGHYAFIHMDTGQVDHSNVPGFGLVNGIAVDTADTIVCDTTEIDFSIGFHNYTTHEGFKVVLKGAQSQANSGTSVAYDPVAKLFFIGQPISSTGPNSSIQIYDPAGNWVKSIDNLHLPASSNPIEINPSTRTGFVISSQDESELQGFSY